MSEMICYCFSYTENDIISDVVSHNGHSTIMDRIMMKKKASKCRCKETNPKGK